MRTVKNSMALVGSSLLAVAFATPATAQDSGVQSAAAFDGIIVEARRRDESIQDVPGVVNAVTSEELDKLNIAEFSEVATIVPGLQLQSNANGIGSSTNLRGVKYDVNASGNNGTVEYYYNDAPLSAGFVLNSLFDVGQIEVLRGPQGTLRGRASPSGSITVRSKRADLSEFGGYAELTGTTRGGINANAAIGVPIIPDKLSIRIAGIISDNEGSGVDSIYGGKNPHSQSKAGRVTVYAEPFEGFTAGATYQVYKNDVIAYDQAESVSLTNTEAGIGVTSAFAGTTLISAKDRKSVMNTPRDIQQKFQVANWTASYVVAGQKLVYVGSWNKQNLDSFTPTDIGDFFGPGFSDTLQTYGQQTHTVSTAKTHELRLQSDERLFGMVDYVIGGLYSTLDSPTSLNSPRAIFFGPLSPSTGFFINQTAVQRVGDTKERSLFGNLTLHVTEGTEISGGARYINFKNNANLLINGNGIFPQNEEYNEWIYSASLKHRFSPSFMAYASFGTAFRPGATAVGDFSVLPFAPVFGLDVTNQTLFRTTDPETSKSYEIGFKSNLLDNRLTLNATIYHQTFKNFVYRSPGNGVSYANISYNTTTMTPSVGLANFNFISGVPVTVNGVEVDFNYQASDRFSFGGSASYSKGKIKNGFIPCNDGNNDGVPDSSEVLPSLASLGTTSVRGCTVNMRANDAPLFTGNVQAEYNQPIGSSEGYLRGLFSYYGNSQANPLSAYDDVKSYGLLNLYVGLRDADGAWDVQFYGKNIFDIDRVLTRTSPLSVPYNVGATGFNGQTSYRTITTTNPAEFGLTVRYSFGSR